MCGKSLSRAAATAAETATAEATETSAAATFTNETADAFARRLRCQTRHR